MTRTFPVVALLATALIASACDQTETSSAKITIVFAGWHIDRSIL